MKLNARSSTLVFGIILCYCVVLAQQQVGPLEHVSHASSLEFMLRDGTCVYGPFSKVTATEITVHPYGEPSMPIQKADLLQISQGNALLFTTFNSWDNVELEAKEIYPREAFLLRLKNGKLVRGKPTAADSDDISLKHGFVTTGYKRSEIGTVDYLRLKPETDGFDSFAQEAPVLLFFDPEFYYRAIGLEGRIPVRIYDAAKPITGTAPKCLTR